MWKFLVLSTFLVVINTVNGGVTYWDNNGASTYVATGDGASYIGGSGNGYVFTGTSTNIPFQTFGGGGGVYTSVRNEPGFTGSSMVYTGTGTGVGGGVVYTVDDGVHDRAVYKLDDRTPDGVYRTNDGTVSYTNLGGNGVAITMTSDGSGRSTKMTRSATFALPSVGPNEGFVTTKILDPTCNDRDITNKCPGPNEEYIFTSTTDLTYDNELAQSCYPGMACRCISGYVRGPNGNCILATDCHPNEEYIHTQYGDPTCDGEAPKLCKPVKEWRCKYGYVRHENKCINASDCPSRCCGENEVYDLIKYEDFTCDCNDLKPVEPYMGCRCKNGFLRHEKKCIPESECPPKCPGKFEEYVITRFEDLTCSDVSRRTCPLVKACRCMEGYVRHNGECIRPWDCPRCPEFEEFVLTELTDATCNSPQGQACEPVRACRCIKDYVRHNGTCIKLCDCPCAIE